MARTGRRAQLEELGPHLAFLCSSCFLVLWDNDPSLLSLVFSGTKVLILKFSPSPPAARPPSSTLLGCLTGPCPLLPASLPWCHPAARYLSAAKIGTNCLPVWGCSTHLLRGSFLPLGSSPAPAMDSIGVKHLLLWASVLL